MATVGDVLLRIEAGRSVKTKERPAQPGEVGILKVSAVTWGAFRPTENKAILDGHEPGDCPRPRRGDVLISRANTRELVGAPVIVEGDFPDLLLSDKILRLVPDDRRVERRYLARALRSAAARAHFEGRAGGTSGSMTNITQDDIRSVPVPLPTLGEQRRIADILDTADAVRRKRKEAIALTEELLRSAFLEMFGDPVTNPKGWEVKPLGDVSDVAGGLQVTHARAPNPVVLPYLRVANVFRDRLDLTQVKEIRVTPAEVERATLRTGDVLVVEGHGNPDELGRAAVWTGEISGCTHQNHLIRVRSSERFLMPIFLSAYLNSAAGRAQMLRMGKTTSGLNTISTNNVRAVGILLPPLDLQRRFASLVDQRGRVRRSMADSNASAESLFASLVDRAFAGGLHADLP